MPLLYCSFELCVPVLFVCDGYICVFVMGACLCVMSAVAFCFL